MRNIWAIARRDFRSYFTSPVGYIVIGVFMGIMGYMFFTNLQRFAGETMFGRSLSITDGIVAPLYGNMSVIYLFLFPSITMRLFAEEKKNHTIELLMTSPVTIMEMVLGKFLSASLLFLVMLALTSVFPITLFLTGNPDIGPILTSLLGTLLMSCCYLAFGVLFSAMTENQVVAYALTFGFVLFFWLINWAQQLAGPVFGEVLNYLSLVSHFRSFGEGIINTSDVVYYLSFTGLGLFLTHRVLDSYRWR